MRHHTKDKGDTGLGFIIADMMSNGVYVALPLSEHLAFDCIAMDHTGVMKRVSVKYRTALKGRFTVEKRSVWSNQKGVHVKKHEHGQYDAFAIYCPSNRKCYYLNFE